MEKTNKTRCLAIVALSFVAVAGIVLGVFLFLHRQGKNTPSLSCPQSVPGTTAITDTMPSTTTTTNTIPSTTAPSCATEPKHEHNYTTEKIVGTCTSGGYTLYTCACGSSYRSEETKANGHQYGDAAEKEASCTAQGGLIKTCKTCGHKDIENAVAALGHSWSDWETTKEATISAAGEKVRTCGRCEKTEKKTIAKIEEPEHEHSYAKTVVDATCKSKGYTRYTCACGKSYDSDIVSARGHLYGDWVTVVKPTATEEGKKEATCRWCENTISESVPKLTEEEVELYKKYIDPKIEIRTNPDGAKSYRYKGVSVIDTRSWGDPPAIKVVNDSAFSITYAKKDGTIVKFTLRPVEGYIRRFIILENGSYEINLIGDFSD